MRDTAERKWASGTLWERSMQRAELPCGALPFVYLTRDRREPPQQRGGFRIFRGARRAPWRLAACAALLLWRKPPRFVIARRPQADVAISRHMAGLQENHRRNRSCLPEIAPQGHFLALRAQGATAPSGPRNDKAGGFPHSSFFSLQDSFISVPLPYNTRLTALQNFPLSIFDFPRSPILFFSVFLYKYFRIESAKIRKKINKVRKYP